MILLPATLLALLLGSAQAAPAAQEEALEMKWAIQDGDRFDLKWSYNDQRKREPGHGDVTEGHDKRDVDAELAWKEEGILSLTLKKVAWSYGSQDYDIALTYVEGKKLDPQLKMKIAPTAAGYNVSKPEADRILEYMRKLTEGEFTINIIEEPGKTKLLWNGQSVRGGNVSLFDHLFTHPTLSSGPKRVGQSFKDPFDASGLPPGMVDVKEVETKVTAVGEKGIIAKGGFTYPLARVFSANGQNQTVSGTFTYGCEWNYSPKQYLQGAKEDLKLQKKVDAHGKDAAFYKENFTHTVSQTLTIKKKDANPSDEKKKPEEPAKPEEKK